MSKASGLSTEMVRVSSLAQSVVVKFEWKLAPRRLQESSVEGGKRGGWGVEGGERGRCDVGGGGDNMGYRGFSSLTK